MKIVMILIYFCSFRAFFSLFVAIIVVDVVVLYATIVLLLNIYWDLTVELLFECVKIVIR